MKVCVIQPYYSFEGKDTKACYDGMVELLNQCDDSMDIIVLPEACDVPAKARDRETYDISVDKYNKKIKDKEEERLEFLKEYISFNDETENLDFKIEQINVLTYQNTKYYFKGYELIKKEEITNEQIESEDLNTSEESRDNYDN